MNTIDDYELYFDGCSKGNPGLAGAGAVIYKNKTEMIALSEFVGEYKTNNVAEYTGLIIGLKAAINLHIKHLSVKGDSLLVIKQMKGEYKVNSPSILVLHKEATQLKRQFNKITFEHVYRKDNKRADELSNNGLLLYNPKESQ
jgi:ribonuclease HI